jgi:hypothetical protein
MMEMILSSSLSAREHLEVSSLCESEVITMRIPTRLVPVAAVLLLLISATSQAALTPYSQDFEGLVQSDTSALANDGWLVYGNVFESDGVTYIRGYGPYPAPNDGYAFCQIDVGQGGTEQGYQQLVVFSDYNNTDHGLGDIIESNVYQEQTIEAADVGSTWTFEFQAKLGNITGSSTAAAFIKTLDPNNGYALTNFLSLDMTSIPVTWGGYWISITIDASLDGQLLQIGFLNRATNYEGSGIFYDNLWFHEGTPTATTPARSVLGAKLEQNFPNPFNPSTRIDFSLDRPQNVEIVVFDLAGRKVAELYRGNPGIGPHSVTWNGRADSGAPVASGRYTYVLKTASGQVSHSMVLVK